MAKAKGTRKPRQRKLVNYRLDKLPIADNSSDPEAKWEEVTMLDTRNDAKQYAELHADLYKNKFHYSITQVIRILDSKPKNTRELI